MDGFAVFHEDNPKVAIFHLGDLRPPAETSVFLNYLTYGVGTDPLNPGVRDHGPIRTGANGVEVGSGLHSTPSYRRMKAKVGPESLVIAPIWYEYFRPVTANPGPILM